MLSPSHSEPERAQWASFYQSNQEGVDKGSSYAFSLSRNCFIYKLYQDNRLSPSTDQRTS